MLRPHSRYATRRATRVTAAPEPVPLKSVPGHVPRYKQELHAILQVGQDDRIEFYITVEIHS